MYLEQRVEQAVATIEKMAADVEALRGQLMALEQGQTDIEARMEEAIRNVSASSGAAPEAIAKLMVEIAQNIYPGIHPTAPKGSAQDDGEPTEKPGTAAKAVEASPEAVGIAQKAGASPPPPSDGLANSASDGGSRSPEVVAPSGEAPASPAVDAEPSIHCMIEGRAVTGPRAAVFVQVGQAKILRRLLQGPATLHDLTAAWDSNGNVRETQMRMANMRSLLADAGLEIVESRKADAVDVFRLREKGL